MTGRRLLPAVLAAAFILRVGAGLARPQPGAAGFSYTQGVTAGKELDPDGYVTLALSVADAWEMSEDGKPSAHREPAYPVVLGLAFKLFGRSYPILLALNSLFSTLTLFVLFLAGRRLWGDGPALLAAGIGAVYPPFIYYAVQPLRESFMLFMGASLVLALLEAWRRKTAAAFAGAGAVAALAGLTNTTFLPFGLVAAPLGLLAVSLLDRDAPPRERWSRPARWGAAYLAVMLPLYASWPLRNRAVFGTWIMGSTAGAGSTFYTYLIVPQELGGTPRQNELLAADPVTREGSAIPDPVAREQFFWKAGFAKVRQAPGRYLRLVCWRLFRDQWRLAPRPRAYGHSYPLVRLAAFLTDGWIIPLGFVGVALMRLKPAEALWPYLFVLSLSFLYSLIFTMLRYRLSIMPWMILFASCALWKGWERWLVKE